MTTATGLRKAVALTAAAAELIAAGGQPTVAEVAEAAKISRSTAYRYFPSQELLYAEVALNAAVGNVETDFVMAVRAGDLLSPECLYHVALSSHRDPLVDLVVWDDDRLVDGGRSVIVIEHHQAVMAHADWIIDLGPGAGHDGGQIVFEGTPADLVATQPTLTGRHLADYVT